MSDPTFQPPESQDGADSADPPGPVIRDRRRLDPLTGQVRPQAGATGPASSDPLTGQVRPQAGANGPASSDPLTGQVRPQAGANGPASSDPLTGQVRPQAGANGPASSGPASSDPLTGQVREAYGASNPIAEKAPVDGPVIGAAGAELNQDEEAEVNSAAETVALDGILADLDAAQASAAERLSDLQRLQAEFINYRRRVDRDRDVARDSAVAAVLEALLPVLDDVHLARQHGDLESGPFAAIAEKLETILERFGLQRYGDTGEEFDPAVHEALMHTQAELGEGTTATTVVQVLQPGYRAGDRVLRAARVAVADPQ